MLKWQKIIDERIYTEKGLKAYVKRYQKQLFFTKQKSWEGKNEYRVLSNGEDYQDIRGAISTVYLTSCWSQECLFLEKFVSDNVPVMYLSYVGTYNNWAVPTLKVTKEQREHEYKLKELQEKRRKKKLL